MGLGLQWNLWYGETHYDAYPHRLSLAVEGQHAFTSYLRENNVVFLIVRTQW
jgi:adsorption protein A